MADMGDYFNEMREYHQARKARNLAKANPDGWTVHSEHHWSRDLCGDRLDYWPSRNKFRWQGKTHCGDVDGFIRNRENRAAEPRIFND